MPPAKEENTATVSQKVKSIPPRQSSLPHPVPSAQNITAAIANVSSTELCRWGPGFPVCLQSAPNPEPGDSDWEEKDWDGDIAREKEKENQRKEEELNQKLVAEEQATNYYPPSPQYKPLYEEDPINPQD